MRDCVLVAQVQPNYSEMNKMQRFFFHRRNTCLQ